METNLRSSSGGKGLLIVAWLIVLVPAAWGITQTIRQSMTLFETPATPTTQAVHT